MATEFDQNRITVRPRGLLEIMDLALVVMREMGMPLAYALAVGALPLALLNAWVAGELAPLDLDYDEPAYGYMLCLSILMVIEAPLATALATLYLGQAMFNRLPSWKSMLHDLRRAAPQLILFQVFVRGFLGCFWFLLLVPLAIPSIAWPYLNEVILLERNPMLSRKARRLTTFARSRALHGAVMGDLFARWLGAASIAAALVVAIWFSLGSLISLGSGKYVSLYALYVVLFPLASWTVIGYFTVVRFLCYMDLRIRREGWEVELAMRAEAARLAERQGKRAVA